MRTLRKALRRVCAVGRVPWQYPHGQAGNHPHVLQTGIVHLIRHSLAFVSWKDRKAMLPELRWRCFRPIGKVRPALMAMACRCGSTCGTGRGSGARAWLASHLYEKLELDRLWSARLPERRKGTRRRQILQTLVCCNLIDPGSE
jgi:hypothetical protein